MAVTARKAIPTRLAGGRSSTTGAFESGRPRHAGHRDCRLPGVVFWGLLVFLAAMVGPGGKVWGQNLQSAEIASSPNPVGSGARALGMGGAFIGVADDATAASWNPGGLTQLERPEVSVVGEAFLRTEDNSFWKHPEASGDQSVSKAGLNYLSAACPFVLAGHNMVVALNYQHLYDFGREWNTRLWSKDLKQTWSVDQGGGLYALGFAWGVQIHPSFSVGCTLNLWEDFLYTNGWEQVIRTRSRVRDAVGHLHTVDQHVRSRYGFSGWNANVGVLWNITDHLSLGGVFKTPFTADITHRTTSLMRFHPNAAHRHAEAFDEELDMPMSYGLGLAYRFSDSLTVALDVYRTEWEDFLYRDARGKEFSAVSGLPRKKSDIDATTQVRVGFERLFIRPNMVIPLRGGFFYDPAPAEGGSDPYFGFSLGSGIGIGRYILDIAYQVRLGMDVGSSIVRPQKLSQDVSEHTLFTSLVIHF